MIMQNFYVKNICLSKTFSSSGPENSLSLSLSVLIDNQFLSTALCTNICQNGGTCVARDNTGVCECPIGFYGSRCEIPVNYCITGSCYNQGTCNTGTAGFTCSCPAGKHFPTTDIYYGFKIEKISNLKNSMQVSELFYSFVIVCIYLM